MRSRSVCDRFRDWTENSAGEYQVPIKRNGEPEPEPAPVTEALGREATESVRRQEHRHLSAAGHLILTGTKHLWLLGDKDLRQRAAVEFRRQLIQDCRPAPRGH